MMITITNKSSLTINYNRTDRIHKPEYINPEEEIVSSMNKLQTKDIFSSRDVEKGGEERGKRRGAEG